MKVKYVTLLLLIPAVSAVTHCQLAFNRVHATNLRVVRYR